MRPITARPARFRQKHCKPYTLCKALYQHGPPLAGDGAGVLHSDCRESDRERKSKSNGSSPEEEAEPNEQGQIPFPTGSINPNKPQRRARDKGTTENHSPQREGRARWAAPWHSYAEAVAEHLPAMSADTPTRSATMSKPSMEAEPMRGRTSTPAAGRQGTGKGGEDAAPSCGPVSP